VSILLQDVALVAATAVRVPDLGACVLAQLALIELTLIHILLLLHRIGSVICSTDGEGLLGELVFRDCNQEFGKEGEGVVGNLTKTSS